MEMKFDYTVTSSKDFDEAVAAVEAKAQEKGFKVLYTHDTQANLKDKGFEIEPFKTVEICNAKFAHKVLRADKNIGLMMPCKINVYREEDKTIISAMRPLVISQFFPDADLGEIPKEIDSILKSIVDEAK